tara:strand:+ start:794 stop:1054 length:261 start_codon:yes stop_codon:yes gene_type:complete
MPELVNKVTGAVVEKGPYGGEEEEKFIAEAEEKASKNPLLGVTKYQFGGILNRAPNGGYRSTVHEARGGGAARKGSTRFYVVSADK